MSEGSEGRGVKDSPRIFGLSTSMESPLRFGSGGGSYRDGRDSPPLFMLNRPSEMRGSVAEEEGEDDNDDDDKEEGGASDELDVTIWVDHKTRLKTPYTVRQVVDAQGIILDMYVWLRGRRVISEILEYLFFEEEGEEGAGAEEESAWQAELLKELKSEGRDSVTVDEVIWRVGGEERARDFVQWGQKAGRFEVVFKMVGEEK